MCDVYYFFFLLTYVEPLERLNVKISLEFNETWISNIKTCTQAKSLLKGQKREKVVKRGINIVNSNGYVIRHLKHDLFFSLQSADGGQSCSEECPPST